MFGNGSLKFERVAAYLITNYNAVSSNLRDIFTAGGLQKIKIGSKKVELPRIAHNLYLGAKQVKETLSKIDREKLSYYWQTQVKGDTLETWQKLVEKNSKEFENTLDIIAVFNAGLKNAEN